MNSLFDLKLSFLYKANIAGNKYEYNPVIQFWNTTNNLFVSNDLKEFDFDNSKNVKYESTIKLDLNNLSQDASIYGECIVISKNDENKETKLRAGICQLFLSEILKTNKVHKLSLLLKTLDESDLKYINKGTLFITILNANEFKNVAKFKAKGIYDLIEENKENVFKIIENSKKERYEILESENYNILRCEEKLLEDLKCYYWRDVYKVPILFYFIDYTTHDYNEFFCLNLLNISLNREGMNMDLFINIIERQFNSTNSILNSEFNDCLYIIVTCISLISTSIYYKTDETIIKESNGNIKVIPIESFNDALRLLSGDCEDLGNTIKRICNYFEDGNPDLKNTKNMWQARGSWNNKALQCIQRVLFLYIPFVLLSSVTAPKTGNESREGKRILINSFEDKQSQVGAHMYCMLYPMEKFKRHSNFQNFNIEKEDKNLNWINRLPVLSCEGTGWIHPFLVNWSFYESDKKTQSFINKEEQLKRLSVLKSLDKHKVFYDCQTEKVPLYIDDINEARISLFYRQGLFAYTNKLLKLGYECGEFALVAHGDNTDINKNDDQILYGVNIREMLLGDKTRFIAFPGFKKEEKEAIKSVLSHFPPIQYPTLTEEYVKKINGLYDPFIIKLQLEIDIIMNKKIINIRKSKMELHTIVTLFRGKEMLYLDDEDNVIIGNEYENLLDSLKEDNSIMNCELDYEVIDKNIVNMIAKITVDINKI